MFSNRTHVKTILAVLLLSTAATAQTHIPATGLCNTGLTPAGPLPKGCTTSTLVTPVNPQSGGPSVDGNWQLATPYPSAAYNQQAPDPCALTTFGPAWVDTPTQGWFNPNDGLSQLISPEADGPYTTGGWYIYATTLPVPATSGSYTKYNLTVTGQLMADDVAAAIFLDNAGIGCRPMAFPSLSPVIGSNFEGWTAWNPFHFEATVTPSTSARLYFLVYNLEFAPGDQNGTGFRAEFTSAYFTPE